MAKEYKSRTQRTESASSERQTQQAALPAPTLQLSAEPIQRDETEEEENGSSYSPDVSLLDQQLYLDPSLSQPFPASPGPIPLPYPNLSMGPTPSNEGPTLSPDAPALLPPGPMGNGYPFNMGEQLAPFLNLGVPAGSGDLENITERYNQNYQFFNFLPTNDRFAPSWLRWAVPDNPRETAAGASTNFATDTALSFDHPSMMEQSNREMQLSPFMLNKTWEF